ncbi:hypothetical protein C3B78_17355 [Arthrobacter sp. PGP41]|nr:hypothetical protein C3B78_17355 [Arthrobacter sp. PGP41]
MTLMPSSLRRKMTHAAAGPQRQGASVGAPRRSHKMHPQLVKTAVLAGPGAMTLKRGALASWLNPYPKEHALQ